MKKILIISHWFYPRNIPRAFRAKELIDELIRKGYSVDLIFGDKKCFLTINDFDYYYNTNNQEVPVNNTLITLSNNWLTSKIKNIVEYLIGERYLLTSFLYVFNKIKLENYDCVISIGLPFYSHLACAIKLWIKKLKNLVSISDWGDPFYTKKQDSKAIYFKWLQRFVCQQFDYITIPTDKAINYYLEYTDKNKIFVIPQGINFDKIKRAVYRKNKIPQFGYAGIFYSDIRNPTSFFEYLSHLDIDFIFHIFTITHGTMYTDIIMKYKQILGDKLQIHPIIPRLECIERLSSMDFLINIENIVSEQIPSKLIDYSLSGRPILSFKQNDFPKEKFLNFISGNYKGQTIIDLEKYDIKTVCAQFIKLIEKNNP